jgi:hypothetical protein
MEFCKQESDLQDPPVSPTQKYVGRILDNSGRVAYSIVRDIEAVFCGHPPMTAGMKTGMKKGRV